MSAPRTKLAQIFVTVCVASIGLLSATYSFGREPRISNLNNQVAISDYKEAVKISRQLGLGTMTIEGPTRSKPLIAGSFDTFKFRFQTGRVTIETSGVIRLSMRHVFHWTQPQTGDPKAPGYVTVQGPKHAKLEVVTWPANPDAHDLFLEMFPWQHAIEVRVTAGTLRPGDSFVLIYGDRSQGGIGTQVQPTAETAFLFRTFVRTKATDNYLPLPKDVTVEIIGGEAVKLRAVAQNTTDPGVARLTVSAEDRFGNADPTYNRTVTVGTDSVRKAILIAFSDEDHGVKTVRLPVEKIARSRRFFVDDGTRKAWANPIQTPDKPQTNLMVSECSLGINMGIQTRVMGKARRTISSAIAAI